MLTLFHDVTSPASAVAIMRLGRLSADGLAVAFEGFEAVGIDVALPVDVPTLAMIDRLRDEADAEGLRLRRPAVTPPTGLAHVLLAHAEGSSVARAVREGVYRAYWQDGADIADAAVLCDIAVRAELDGTAVAELLDDRVALAGRRRQMAARRREGVGGVPVILASRTLVPGLMPDHDLRAMAAMA